MRRGPAVLRVAGIALCAVGSHACGLADLFAPAGPQSSELIWQGDVELSAGDTIPLRIVVTADGRLVERPHLRISVLSTSVLALTPAADSLVGLRPGNGEVRVQFDNALLGRFGPDTVFAVRVTGAP